MRKDGVGHASVWQVERKLDSSGRFKIPKRWFEKMGHGKCVYLMPDPEERCLRLIPQGEMEKRLEKLRDLALGDPAANRASQVVERVAEVQMIDSKECVVVKNKLLDYARIKRRLIMVGGEWYTQLWSPMGLLRETGADKVTLTRVNAKMV